MLVSVSTATRQHSSTRSIPVSRSGTGSARRETQTSGIPSATAMSAALSVSRKLVVPPRDRDEIQVDGHDLIGVPEREKATNTIDGGSEIHPIDQDAAEVDALARFADRVDTIRPRCLPRRLLDRQRLSCHASTSIPHARPAHGHSTVQ